MNVDRFSQQVEKLRSQLQGLLQSYGTKPNSQKEIITEAFEQLNIAMEELIIVTLAHKLGVNVLAEGVETKEQLALLRKLNCQYGQGHFFSVPLNSSAAEALIMQNPQWGAVEVNSSCSMPVNFR